MNQSTMIESAPIPQAIIEPVKLVGMWREAAMNLQGQMDGGARDEELRAAAGAFIACAQMLETYIHHEGQSVIMCMPRSLLHLMFAAHEFDSRDKETWKGLGHAAEAFRGTAS